MTEKEIIEKIEELEQLKLLLKFHSESRIIKAEIKFIDHVDEILDEINRLAKELEKE